MKNASTPMISRSSIFIISYFLLNSGLNFQLPEPLAANWVRLGIIGLVSFMALEWAGCRREAALQAEATATGAN